MTVSNFGMGVKSLSRSAKEALRSLPRLRRLGLLTETLRRELAERLDREIFAGSATVDMEGVDTEQEG